FLRERRLDQRYAVQIASAICKGLTAVHRIGVIHRDIKPTNILIDHEGRVVLTDFGIARSLVEELSLTTGMVGTPYYMAPEQAYGGPVDARADVYALGRILYEMLVGERGDATPEVLAEKMAQAGIPESLTSLTLRCLEREPLARFGSAAEVE